jgi:hypothetical protein
MGRRITRAAVNKEENVKKLLVMMMISVLAFASIPAFAEEAATAPGDVVFEELSYEEVDVMPMESEGDSGSGKAAGSSCGK